MQARHLAMYLMHVSLGRTMTDVAAMMGRARTTVSYACGLVEDMRDDKVYNDSVCRLEMSIDALVHGVAEAEHGAP